AWTGAGTRIESRPWLACEIGIAPAATSAADPALDAPALCSTCHGDRTGPSRGCSLLALKPYSESWVLPSGISPVARYIRAKSPSFLAVYGSHASVPSIVGIPATSTLSLTTV